MSISAKQKESGWYLESSPKTWEQLARTCKTIDIARQPRGHYVEVSDGWKADIGLAYLEAISAMEKATAFPPKITRMHP